MEHFLDPDFLNLLENQFTTHLQLLQYLFSRWLSFPRSTKLVKALVSYVEDRNLVSVPGSSVYENRVESNLVSNAISRAIGYTRPSNIGSSDIASKNQASSSSTPPAFAGDVQREVIPQFYFPSGRSPTSELREQCLSKINNFFSGRFELFGLDINGFKDVTKEVCMLPFFLSSALFYKTAKSSSRVTRYQFIQHWVDGNMLTMDKSTQIFHILKQPDRDYLTPADFVLMFRELCASHPGLELIRESRDDQKDYSETVIYRIFYYINRSGNGRITLREFKRGDLVAAMQLASEEEDINKVLRYFSYNHALVIRSKFMELDRENRFIDKTDLANYRNRALSNRILDRIFSQEPRRFKSNVNGWMSYQDFVYFILAEEDKQSEPSLEYWFKCIDLDGNGILTNDELKHFYEEQIQRMKSIDENGYVPFEVTLDRIYDMIAPEGKDGITLRDVKASKLSGDFFNILFSFDKFVACLGNRTRKEHLRENLTEWDWFAQKEFEKLTKGDVISFDEDQDSDGEEVSSPTRGRSETDLHLSDDKPKPKKLRN